MDATVDQYKDIADNKDQHFGEKEKEIDEVDPNLNKDSLVFHGVALDQLEEETKLDDEAIKKNFIEHKIRSIMKSEWGIDCNASFKHVFRYFKHVLPEHKSICQGGQLVQKLMVLSLFWLFLKTKMTKNSSG